MFLSKISHFYLEIVSLPTFVKMQRIAYFLSGHVTFWIVAMVQIRLKLSIGAYLAYLNRDLALYRGLTLNG